MKCCSLPCHVFLLKSKVECKQLEIIFHFYVLDNGPNHEDDLEKVRLVFSRVKITFLTLRYLKINFFLNLTSQLKIINFN